MQLVWPFVADEVTMRSVCTDRHGNLKYSDDLLKKLPKWIQKKENHRMTLGSQLVGFSRTMAVWEFGFLPGSSDAEAYNINVGDEGFLFVLADHSGNIQDIFNGLGMELPDRFRKIIDSKPFRSQKCSK